MTNKILKKWRQISTNLWQAEDGTKIHTDNNFTYATGVWRVKRLAPVRKPRSGAHLRFLKTKSAARG